MKNILFIIITALSFQLSTACDCLTFNEAQKKALQNNQFILLHFSNCFTFEADKPLLITGKYNHQEQQLLSNFVYVCLPKNNNDQYYNQYNIKSSPELLIVDVNGKLLYQFTNYKDPLEFITVLQNFILPQNILSGDIDNYNKKKGYNTAARLALKYLDYSLDVNKKYIYNISGQYIAEAEALLSKKDPEYNQKVEKLQIFKLYHWAYQKDFSLLNEKLATYDESKINQDNLQYFYFLKYITAKALQAQDLAEIQSKTLQLPNFDFFIKKADLILSN